MEPGEDTAVLTGKGFEGHRDEREGTRHLACGWGDLVLPSAKNVVLAGLAESAGLFIHLMPFSSTSVPKGMGNLFLCGQLDRVTFPFMPKHHLCWQLAWVSGSWQRSFWVPQGAKH